MLTQFENSSHAGVVGEVVISVQVEGVGVDEDTAAFRSNLAMRVASLLRSEPKRRRIPPPALAGKHRLV